MKKFLISLLFISVLQADKIDDYMFQKLNQLEYMIDEKKRCVEFNDLYYNKIKSGLLDSSLRININSYQNPNGNFQVYEFIDLNFRPAKFIYGTSDLETCNKIKHLIK